MKILSVVGARPQFVKLAPIHHALIAAGHQHVIVHTGQHYDRDMSDVFFEDLDIPKPDENLAVGSASHGQQTAAMLGLLEESFLRHTPDWVLVYGDTNSTLAASVAAVKIHQRLVHLEAGLRSFNRRMPEEHNRVLTDHAADLLLAPTDVAAQHLANEGLSDRTVVVGDVMTDICLATRDRIKNRPPQMPDSWLANEQYIVSTIHRQENTDDPNRLDQILGYLAA
jgi:UDP-N-acetylglucosamine 2-epimerase (non-hydrolysing)